MNKKLALLASALVACAATAAHADSYDCFPGCGAAGIEPAAESVINLCENKAVREVARMNAKLKPAKEIYDIAMNPTGYAIRTATRMAGIEVPKIVDYAIDPKGALKAEVMKRVREEAKKRVGLADECKADLESGEAAEVAAAEAEEV